MSNIIELTPQPVGIVEGLRNLANRIESNEETPECLVWVIQNQDNIQVGILGDGEELEAHLVLAKAQRAIEGCY